MNFRKPAFAKAFLWSIAVGALLLGSTGDNIGIGKVSADTYPGTNGHSGLGPDTNPHNACWVPNPSTATIPDHAWDHFFGYMNVNFASATGISITWTTNCNNTVDMRLDDRLANDSFFGLATCISASGTVCNSWNVEINTDEITEHANNAGATPYSFLRFNWCHESGHSIGLGHENSCMRTGFHFDQVYSAHHVSHINARF